MTFAIGSLVRLSRIHDTHAARVKKQLGRAGVVQSFVRSPVEKYLLAFPGAELWIGPAYLDLASPLTPRESVVLFNLAAGLSNRAIAERLGISGWTVKHHLTSVYAKLGVWGRVEAAVMFIFGAEAGYGVEIAEPAARAEKATSHQED